MPLLFIGAGALLSWAAVQADDVVENFTGERGGIPYLQLGILLLVGFLIWSKFK